MNGIALLNVHNEEGLEKLSKFLVSVGITLAASGGTAATLQKAGLKSVDISALAGSLDVIGAQVTAVHPDAKSGILNEDGNLDKLDTSDLCFSKVKYVVVNLKPFSKLEGNTTFDSISLDGITMLRAGAKNHKRVTVICDTKDYGRILKEVSADSRYDTSLSTRQKLALKAFNLTSNYDDCVANYMRKQFSAGRSHLSLKYGLNPHQKPAQLFTMVDQLPMSVLNGSPDYINLCNALIGYELVSEIREALDVPAAASFKHLNPTGVAIGVPLSEATAKVCLVHDMIEWMSPLACAVARARGTDRTSTFGDFIALSNVCDVATARVILREVSDGIIAPGYTDEALEILSAKQGGSYCILEIDALYAPADTERRTVFGLTLEQKRNFRPITVGSFHNLVSLSQEMPMSVMQDLVVATCTAKYTQSNAVVLAKDGQTIGIGAGQQSRMRCTRLATAKADHWWLLHHPQVLNQHSQENHLRSPELSDLMNQLVLMPQNAVPYGPNQGLIAGTSGGSASILKPNKTVLTDQMRTSWMLKLARVSMASDGAIPDTNIIIRGYQSGVKFIAAPGGSHNEAKVLEVCNQLNMTVARLVFRMLHH